jgi:hypothetical protein
MAGGGYGINPIRACAGRAHYENGLLCVIKPHVGVGVYLFALLQFVENLLIANSRLALTHTVDCYSVAI